MIAGAVLLHYISQALAIGLSSIGGSIGQGIAASASLQAMDRQFLGTEQIFKSMIIGLALIETGTILALVLTLLLLFSNSTHLTMNISIAELGITLSIGIAASAVGFASSFAVCGAVESVARQPFFSQKILIIQVIIQSIIESPALFAFIIGILIFNQIEPNLVFVDAMRLLAAGLTIGIGSIGPSIGQAIFAQTACKSIGLNKEAYPRLFSFALLSETIIETPIIFCLLISFILLFKGTPIGVVGPIASMFAAAFVIAIGIIGPSIAIGRVTAQSCAQIIKNQAIYPLIIRTTFMSAGFIDSSAIYALIVALILVAFM